MLQYLALDAAPNASSRITIQSMSWMPSPIIHECTHERYQPVGNFCYTRLMSLPKIFVRSQSRDTRQIFLKENCEMLS